EDLVFAAHDHARDEVGGGAQGGLVARTGAEVVGVRGAAGVAVLHRKCVLAPLRKTRSRLFARTVARPPSRPPGAFLSRPGKSRPLASHSPALPMGAASGRAVSPM